MKKTLKTVLASMALMSATMFPMTTLARTNPSTAPVKARRSDQKQEKRERHPAIKQAVQALEKAKTDLQNAAHDFCGHRVEALEATNKALTQLKLALQCDKQ